MCCSNVEYDSDVEDCHVQAYESVGLIRGNPQPPILTDCNCFDTFLINMKDLNTIENNN